MSTLYAVRYNGFYREALLLERTVGRLPAFLSRCEHPAHKPVVPSRGNLVLVEQTASGYAAKLMHTGELHRLHFQNCVRLAGCLCNGSDEHGAHRPGCPQSYPCKCMQPSSLPEGAEVDALFAPIPIPMSLYECVPYTWADGSGRVASTLSTAGTMDGALTGAHVVLSAMKPDAIKEFTEHKNPVVEFAEVRDLFSF